MSRKYPSAGFIGLWALKLQWGRDKNVSEMFVCTFVLKSHNKLQWGRDKNVSEMLRTRLMINLATLLQWGRDKNVSEMVMPHCN